MTSIISANRDSKLNIFASQKYLKKIQKQPPRGVLKKRYSENMQKVYRERYQICRLLTFGKKELKRLSN